MDRITLLIVDDNFVVRRGIRSLLQPEKHIIILGEASTGKEATQIVQESPVDVVLMDLRMPDMNGIRATAEILRIRPESKVLVLTVVEDPVYLAQAILAGAAGHLVYGHFTSEKLIEAIRTVRAGGTIITPSIASVLLDLASSGTTDAQAKAILVTSNPLSPRESEILNLIAAGKGNRDIAEILHIEEKTVKNHINNIYSKLHIKSRYEAISHVLRQPL